MKFMVAPKTRQGKWSVALFALSLLLAIASSVISSVQNNTIEYPNPINSPLLGSVIYLMFMVAMMASIVGILALLTSDERSIFVYLSIPFGILSFLGILMLSIGNLVALAN